MKMSLDPSCVGMSPELRLNPWIQKMKRQRSDKDHERRVTFVRLSISVLRRVPLLIDSSSFLHHDFGGGPPSCGDEQPEPAHSLDTGRHRRCGGQQGQSASPLGLDRAQRRPWGDRRPGAPCFAPRRAPGRNCPGGRGGRDCVVWHPWPRRVRADADQAAPTIRELVGAGHRVGGLCSNVPHLLLRGRTADQRP